MESTSAMKGKVILNWASVGQGSFFCCNSSKELYIFLQHPKVLYKRMAWSLLGYNRTLIAFLGVLSGSFLLFIYIIYKNIN
jgi:hypothetical protein